MTERVDDATCPRCGAADPLRILYGMPGWEAKAAADRGEVVLGGCMIDDWSPANACRACDHQWGALEDRRPRPLERVTFDGPRLLAEHPPVLRDPNKRLVFGIAYRPGETSPGPVEYARWPELPLPPFLTQLRSSRVLAVPGWYSYAPIPGHVPEEGTVEWHVNFAAAELFGYYAGRHFAQDEAQVAEHPILASVREALIARGLPARTEVDGRPTPVLIRGAERRVAIATDPDPAAGVEGIYGNRFGRATPEMIRAATRRIEPPTRTNVIAIAAPAHGQGRYTEAEIRRILTIAWSGFLAAVGETDAAGARSAWIHTGYWGCGAYGGNRELLSLLQLAAAEAAGIERLVFWTGQPGGEAAFEAARRALDELVPEDGIGTDAFIRDVAARGYEWGWGNGT